MKTFLLSGWLAVLSCTGVFAAPCLPGNLQTFIDLGATGCQVDTVQFTDFTILPEQIMGTPIDPAQVQVTPGGTVNNPMLSFMLNSTANADEVLESLFRFSASNALTGASIGLTSPTVTGDAAVIGILDVCSDGSFEDDTPFGCPTSPATLLVFAIDQSSLLSASANFASSSFFDVVVNLRLDGGQNGSVTLDSATVAFTTVPEPSAGLLVGLGLSAAGVALRARRRMFSGRV